jgi:homoserine O-succinyltransferase
MASPQTGWTVATRETGGRLLILLQGHPEYGVTTLLKEYRRDVRRFLEGSQEAHPEIPINYLDRPGVGLLEAFRTRCESPFRASGEAFPFQAAADHIRARWDDWSRRLFVNWIADARLRSALIASRR